MGLNETTGFIVQIKAGVNGGVGSNSQPMNRGIHILPLNKRDKDLLILRNKDNPQRISCSLHVKYVLIGKKKHYRPDL